MILTGQQADLIYHPQQQKKKFFFFCLQNIIKGPKMTVNLYKWTGPDHFEQIKQYFIRHNPSSSHIVGYLMNTGFYDSDSPGEFDIWSSHPDPFTTEDVVVWFLEGIDRVRFFVSAESRLNFAEYTQEAYEQAFREDKSSGHPDITYFKNEDDEAYYRHSLKVFEEHYVYFMSQKTRAGKNKQIN
jgi:hypothetical protein